MPRIFVVLALGSALSLGGCWEGITRSISASVLSARGEVVVLENGSTNFRPLDSRANLSAGTTLRTSADAQLNLVLIPGALAQISAGSELKIEELRLTKDGNETGDAIRDRRARMELRRGAMVVLFEGFARFNIETDQATINVLPSCLFRIDVDETRTRLTVVRGKLYATAKNGEGAAVDAGATREWPSGPGKSSPVEESQSSTNTTGILQAARELQDLAAVRRDRLPF